MLVAHLVGALLATVAVGLTFIVVASVLFLAFCECTNWAAARYSMIGNRASRKSVTIQRRAA